MKPRCTFITQPLNSAVYQRDEKDMAHIPVEVLYTRPVKSIRIKAIRQDFVSQWFVLKLSWGTAAGSVKLPAGDWFTLCMEAMDEDGEIVETEEIERIGVGEVFVTCGQSNSLNFGDTLTKAESSRVACFNPQLQSWEPCQDPQPLEPGPEVDMGNGGSIWPGVGDLLTEKLGMPIGFYATGWGGAALEEFADHTVKYKRLLNALSRFGQGGVRAVLWHQGETDAVNSTDTSRYQDLLTDLINRTRRDSSWQVPWMVAAAAYHPKADRDKEAAVKMAQLLCCNEKDILKGPNSDILQGEYRILNSAHFTLSGLKAHGKLWAEALLNYIQ